MLKSFHSRSDITKAYIYMHISIILWGATGVLGRGIDLKEGLLVWYRLIITISSMLIYILLTKTALKVTRRHFWYLSGVGVVLLIHWLFFYGAIKYSNVSITLSVFSSTTLFTALIEPTITSKKFNKTELLYSFMAMAGIIFIFYSDTNSFGTGIVLALISAFVGAFFNILNKKVVAEVPNRLVTFYEILAGLIVLTAIMPLYLYIFKPAKLYPDSSDLILLFILAIACTHFTLMLSMAALKHLSAFTLNLAINLEPVYGIALAFFIFHENKHLNSGFFIGTAIIMSSVALHSYIENREKKG